MQAEQTSIPDERPVRRSLFRKAKPFAAPAAAATAEVAPEAPAEEASAPKKRRSPLRLVAIALPVLAVLGGGGAYGWHLWSAEAPHEEAAAETREVAAASTEKAANEHAAPAAEGHGAPVEAASAGGHGEAAPAVPPLPVAVAADDSAVAATDYAIVAVYDDEAILATRRALYRVKVGSTLPSLGEITGVEVVGDGGTVTGSLATLRAASVTAARAVAPAG